MSDLIVNTEPADRLALLGARASVGTVMTNFGFYKNVNMIPALDEIQGCQVK